MNGMQQEDSRGILYLGMVQNDDLIYLEVPVYHYRLGRRQSEENIHIGCTSQRIACNIQAYMEVRMSFRAMPTRNHDAGPGPSFQA
jgi:hypothetical protein